MKWPEIRDKIAFIDDHYSMREDQHKQLFKFALQVPKGGTVLELGTAHGKTAALFTLVGKECGFSYYGIDDFSLEGTFEEVTKTMQSFNGRVNWTLFKSRTQDAHWDKPIDLLFIDAGHDEANVKPDCEKYVPFVKPGGIVIFDDWPQVENDPHWAVGHYGSIATEGWELLEDSLYMRVYRRPK